MMLKLSVSNALVGDVEHVVDGSDLVVLAEVDDCKIEGFGGDDFRFGGVEGIYDLSNDNLGFGVGLSVEESRGLISHLSGGEGFNVTKERCVCPALRYRTGVGSL
jgi:hypothetical protein